MDPPSSAGRARARAAVCWNVRPNVRPNRSLLQLRGDLSGPTTMRGALMFVHQKELAYTVRCDKPNPAFARMLQQAIGGPEGELRVMTQYLFQAWSERGPAKYRDMLLATGTEEIGHVEMLATAVAMNLEGAPSAMVDDIVTNPLVAARMGGVEPRHFLSSGLAAMPSDANGVQFSAACIDVGGNLIANMRANVAAEAIGRTLVTRLLELTDDPGMIDMLRFALARDTMHQQQWLAVLEELGPEEIFNAPGDVPNHSDHEQYAYAFFNHSDTALPEDARFVSGPSLDGLGQFSQLFPAPALGQEPRLRPAPPAAHAGSLATAENGNGGGMLSQVASGVKRA